jgi:tRNA uridine 5-carbamoylmethylation protein Kti12
MIKIICSMVILGTDAAVGHTLENSIPLSIFPVAIDKFCFVFCGLPGRGKTHIARRLARYLEFFHAIPVKVFDVSEYRRRMYSGLKDSAWFDSNNEEGVNIRKICNQAAISDIITFLDEHKNGIAILDSTNPTHARRLNFIQSVQHTGLIYR